MDLLVIGIVALLIILATVYIVKAKKKGVKCIGCPCAGKCASNSNENSHSCCNH